MTQSKIKDTRLAQVSECAPADDPLYWICARYRFHTFTYRDPRSAFSSATGLPIVAPTAVLLGISSTLFSLGEAERAREFIEGCYRCRVVIDPPEGMIFFRVFHQVRRYETDKYKKQRGPNPRMGLTDINQSTREHALVGGEIGIYVGAPAVLKDSIMLALRNRDHLGTRDSMCSLVGDVEECAEPENVVFYPLDGKTIKLPEQQGLIIVMLSRFKVGVAIKPTVGRHWWMSGGTDTELVPYVIPGSFRGTTRGKIYRKIW